MKNIKCTILPVGFFGGSNTLFQCAMVIKKHNRCMHWGVLLKAHTVGYYIQLIKNNSQCLLDCLVPRLMVISFMVHKIGR